MKKFILLLIVPFLSFGQTPNAETVLLKLQDIMDTYPNGMCLYYDVNGNTLFSGEEFSVNHPDAKEVDECRCLYFSGEPFYSDVCALRFWAFPDGRTQFYTATFLTQENELIFEFYKDDDWQMRFTNK